MIIYIIVLVVNALDSDNWHALGKIDIYQAFLGLVAFCGLHEGTGLQGFLYLSGVHLAQGLLQRIESLHLQSLLDFLCIQKTVGHLILYVDVHLGTHQVLFIRFVELGESEAQVGGQCHV